MSRYQQQQAVASAAQAQQQQQQQQRRKAPGFGEEIDEAGGMGDEMDTVSMRDVASVRYVRHHEWMELVLGSAVDSNKILPAKVIPESTKASGNVWQFDDLASIQKRVEELEQENKDLEKQNEQVSSKDEKKEFYERSILKLRDNFGKVDPLESNIDETMIKELEGKLGPNKSIVERKRVRKVVAGGLNLPEPQKKDPNFDQQLQEFQQQKAAAEEEAKNAAAAAEEAKNAAQVAEDAANAAVGAAGNGPTGDGDITMGNSGASMEEPTPNTNDQPNPPQQQQEQPDQQQGMPPQPIPELDMNNNDGDTAMDDLSDVLNM